MKRLKITQIGSRGIPGHRGGVERVLEAVAPRMAAKGHEVTVHCAGSGARQPKQWRGVKLTYSGGINSKYFDTISRSIIATIKESFGPNDIVHFHSSGSAPLAIIPRIFGKKTVVTVHGMDWQRRKWNIFGRWALQFGEWAAVRFPHKTLVVGPDLKQWLDERYKANVIYIPNGVESHAQPEPREMLELGIEKRKFILFLARLVPEKQVHTLIDAWKGIADKKGMKLVIAGPSWHSQEYADDLKRQAAGDPTVLFTGEVSEQMLEELYTNCYCYVLPSEVEGMSLSLLDAMGFGACVICSDILPNKTVVGDAGVTFKVLDTADLRSKLEGIMADPQRAEALRIAARARIDSNFNWDHVADRWLAEFEKLYDDK